MTHMLDQKMISVHEPSHFIVDIYARFCQMHEAYAVRLANRPDRPARLDLAKPHTKLGAGFVPDLLGHLWEAKK